jgi:hypothetical protein
MARDNPDTGVVVRLAGDDRPGTPGPSPAGGYGLNRRRWLRYRRPGLTLSSRQRYWRSGRQKNSSAGNGKTGGTDCPGSGRGGA